MLPRNRSGQVENDWDYRSTPAIPFKKQHRSADRIVMRLLYSEKLDDTELKIQIRRARQLAYVEPWFQEFLPEKLKGRLFIASLGKKFWLIGALDQLSLNNFKFYQKEIRQTLERYLNTISAKEWSIPEFKVQSMPMRSQEKVTEVPDNPVPQFSVRANKSLVANKTKRTIDEILASMMATAKKHDE